MATYQTGPDRWVVSSRGRWLEGIYDTQRTAKYACHFTDAELSSIKHIWRIDGQDRPATMDDLRALRASR